MNLHLMAVHTDKNKSFYTCDCKKGLNTLSNIEIYKIKFKAFICKLKFISYMKKYVRKHLCLFLDQTYAYQFLRHEPEKDLQQPL